MDPNEALLELRKLASAPVWNMGVEELGEVYRRMREVFDGLDDWLCAGNFLPTEWNQDLDKH